MLSKLKALSKAADSPKSVIILERSLFSNKIFMDISATLGKLNELEYHMLMTVFDFFIQNVSPVLNGIIYLKTPVDVCIKRIAIRNRGEESSIDEKYLSLLHEKFEQFANSCTIPTLIIDGNYDLVRDSNKISIDIKDFMQPEISIKY